MELKETKTHVYKLEHATAMSVGRIRPPHAEAIVFQPQLQSEPTIRANAAPSGPPLARPEVFILKS